LAEDVDEGVHGTVDELARSKGIAKSYVSGILRLTLLAPEIVEAILDGLQLDALLAVFSLEWGRQRSIWGVGSTFEPRMPSRRSPNL
jgi:hypothetical protein